jgi:biotin transporter BioY
VRGIGLRRAVRRTAAGGPPGDRASRVLAVVLRLLLCTLVLALSGVTLLSLVAALVHGVTAMPGLLYAFFVADLLLGALLLLISSRRPRRRGRRRATPAAR